MRVSSEGGREGLMGGPWVTPERDDRGLGEEGGRVGVGG